MMLPQLPQLPQSTMQMHQSMQMPMSSNNGMSRMFDPSMAAAAAHAQSRLSISGGMPMSMMPMSMSMMPMTMPNLLTPMMPMQQLQHQSQNQLSAHSDDHIEKSSNGSNQQNMADANELSRRQSTATEAIVAAATSSARRSPAISPSNQRSLPTDLRTRLEACSVADLSGPFADIYKQDLWSYNALHKLLSHQSKAKTHHFPPKPYTQRDHLKIALDYWDQHVPEGTQVMTSTQIQELLTQEQTRSVQAKREKRTADPTLASSTDQRADESNTNKRQRTQQGSLIMPQLSNDPFNMNYFNTQSMMQQPMQMQFPMSLDPAMNQFYNYSYMNQQQPSQAMMYQQQQMQMPYAYQQFQQSQTNMMPNYASLYQPMSNMQSLDSNQMQQSQNASNAAVNDASDAQSPTDASTDATINGAAQAMTSLSEANHAPSATSNASAITNQIPMPQLSMNQPMPYYPMLNNNNMWNQQQQQQLYQQQQQQLPSMQVPQLSQTTQSAAKTEAPAPAQPRPRRARRVSSARAASSKGEAVSPSRRTCSKCLQVHASEASLKTHQKYSVTCGDPNNAQRFTCSTCDKKFAFQSTLNAHMATHGVGVVFRCPICSRTFPFRSKLKAHLETHNDVSTNRTKSQSGQCMQCQRIFNNLAHHLTYSTTCGSLPMAFKSVLLFFSADESNLCEY